MSDKCKLCTKGIGPLEVFIGRGDERYHVYCFDQLEHAAPNLIKHFQEMHRAIKLVMDVSYLDILFPDKHGVDYAAIQRQLYGVLRTVAEATKNDAATQSEAAATLLAQGKDPKRVLSDLLGQILKEKGL